MIRRHIIFHGRVQAVGFRYRASILAEEMHLTGWVKNLYDGTVEMEIQGRALTVSRMLHALQKDRFIRITDMEAEPRPVEPGEEKFRVTY